jgi:hypothetical protein
MIAVLLLALTLLVACDSGVDPEPLSVSYVLTHADSATLPAELVRTFTVTSTTTAGVIEGSLVLISNDSARLALLTESRTLDVNGHEIAYEQYCTRPVFAYRQSGNRLFLDFEMTVQPPSQGFPPVTLVVHDTLIVNSNGLSGRHTLSFAPPVLANRRVELKFMAAPLVPTTCNALP